MFTYNIFHLKILDLNNNMHEVLCFGYEHTIEYIKFVIGHINNIDKKDILLFMNGVELNDNQTFKQNNINENSTIKLYFRINTGIVS